MGIQDQINRAKKTINREKDRMKKLGKDPASSIEIMSEERIENKSYRDENGIIRWENNDSIPPVEILVQVFEGEELKRQVKAKDLEQREAARKYRERMKGQEPSPEQKAEMESAFGKGETVVNVMTGDKTKL